MTITLQAADAVEAILARAEDRAQKAEADNRYLVKENASLWTSIHERDDELREAREAIAELRSMIERAHTERTR